MRPAPRPPAGPPPERARVPCEARLPGGGSASGTAAPGPTRVCSPFGCPSPFSSEAGPPGGREVMNWGRLSPVQEVMRARIPAGRTGRAQGSSGPSTWPGERQVRPFSPHPPPSTPGAQRKTQSIPLSPRRWGCVHLRRLQLAAASPASPLPPSRPPSSPPRPPCSHAKDVTAPPSNHGDAAPRAGGSLERPRRVKTEVQGTG